MNNTDFMSRLHSIVPLPDKDRTIVWANWAEEMADFFAGMLDGSDDDGSSIVGFYRLRSTADNNRQELVTAFHNIRHRYGEEICQQIYELASVPFCLYAWEALDAAESLKGGVAPSTIPKLCKEGIIDLNVPDTPDLMTPDPGDTEETEAKEDCNGGAETD